MIDSKQMLFRGAALAVLGASVASCGSGGGGGGGGGGSTPPTVTKQEDAFGAAFAMAFRAAADSEPYSPMDGDIIPVSLTSEPVDIK